MLSGMFGVVNDLFNDLLGVIVNDMFNDMFGGVVDALFIDLFRGVVNTLFNELFGGGLSIPCSIYSSGVLSTTSSGRYAGGDDMIR